jgi:hypothetical protein
MAKTRVKGKPILMINGLVGSAISGEGFKNHH